MLSKIIHITILIIILCSCLNIAFSQYNDEKVIYRIFPDSLNENNRYEYIYSSLTNFSSDTLVIITDIFVEGITDSLSIYPTSLRYTPSIIFLASKTFPLDFINGWFTVNFRRIPHFVIIKPMSQIVFKMEVNQLHKYIKDQKWKLFGVMSYAYKHDLDSLFENEYHIFKDEFVQSLSVDSIITVKLNLTSSLEQFYSSEKENGQDYNLLKTVFIKRVSSKRY